jgi:integrase|tara:strand:- start:1185 stop:2123 length:939 start_codon:yes stop_codon:yes gene_type:complete
MAKKSVKLAKNFYYSSTGSIEFRKMIRGKLVTGRTGITDPYQVNKLANDIRQKFINEYYELRKPDSEKKKAQHKILLERFLADKKGQGLSVTYIRTLKSNINNYFQNGINIEKSKSFQNAVRRDYNIFARWCQKEGYDLKPVKGPTQSESRKRVLNYEEFQAILHCNSITEDFKDCLEFIYYTGARRKEANAPKKEWLHINNDGGYYMHVVKKGGYKRIVRINSQALEILKRRDFTFWKFRKQWLTRGFKRYARKANIKGVQIHDLRRTFGYNHLKKYGDISRLSKLLGISIDVADKHYTPLLTADIEDYTV